MAEIRNVNIDKEFIVKFGVCRTNFSDDMLSISLEVLPEAIKEVLQETIVEDGEITVTPVKHGECEEIRDAYRQLEGWMCKKCGRETKAKENYCPNCGAKMDGGENNGT